MGSISLTWGISYNLQPDGATTSHLHITMEGEGTLPSEGADSAARQVVLEISSRKACVGRATGTVRRSRR